MSWFPYLGEGRHESISPPQNANSMQNDEEKGVVVSIAMLMATVASLHHSLNWMVLVLVGWHSLSFERETSVLTPDWCFPSTDLDGKEWWPFGCLLRRWGEHTEDTQVPRSMTSFLSRLRSDFRSLKLLPSISNLDWDIHLLAYAVMVVQVTLPSAERTYSWCCAVPFPSFLVWWDKICCCYFLFEE